MTEEKGNNQKKNYFRFQHFWYYYRWHCIIICFLVFAAGFLIKDFASRKCYDMGVTVISSFPYDNKVCEKQIAIFEDIIREYTDYKDLLLGCNFILLPEMDEGKKSYQSSVYLTRLIVEISEGKNCIFVMDENAQDILESYQKEYFSMICKIPKQDTAPGITHELMIGLKASEQSRCDKTTYESEEECFLALYNSFTP